MVDFLNLSEVVANNIINPSDIASGIGIIITLLKAIGILFVIYLVFLVIRSISSYVTNKRIKKIYIKINEMDEKLDIILARQKTRLKVLKAGKSEKTKK